MRPATTISPQQIEPVIHRNDFKKNPIDWYTSIPFIGVHVAAAVGLFFFPLTWKLAAACALGYFVRMFGITAGYHRYFSHRSYKTGRIFQFILGLLGTLAMQKGVMWWASNHRHHHRYSDTPEDIHSPRQSGFWRSHITWVLAKYDEEPKFELVRDLTRFPELVWISKHFLLPIFVLWGVLFLAGGLPLLFWAGVMSTMLCWHATFLVNSLAHVWGSRRFTTTDDSRNNLFIALLTMGEGWHNNHHHYMSSARQGYTWWEIDMSYYILKALSWFGIVRDLRQYPIIASNAGARLDQPKVELQS